MQPVGLCGLSVGLWALSSVAYAKPQGQTWQRQQGKARWRLHQQAATLTSQELTVTAGLPVGWGLFDVRPGLKAGNAVKHGPLER